MPCRCLLMLVLLSMTNLLNGQDTLPAKVYHLAELSTITDSSRGRIQIMDGKTSVLQSMEAHLTILQPGMAAHPPHTHPNEEELIIVASGRIKVTIAGHSTVLEAGGIAYSLPGDEHAAVNIGKTEARYYLIKYGTMAAMDQARAKKAGPSIMMNWSDPVVEKTDRGERRSFFLRRTALFSKFDMHATTLDAGQISHAPHTHRSEEIILVKDGSISMQIEGKSYPASIGDLVFLPTGVLHNLTNTGSARCTYFAFQWE